MSLYHSELFCLFDKQEISVFFNQKFLWEFELKQVPSSALTLLLLRQCMLHQCQDISVHHKKKKKRKNIKTLVIIDQDTGVTSQFSLATGI